MALLCGVLVAQASEVKYQINFTGNDHYSEDDLLAQSGIPEEFGLVDASRRDFLMKIARNSLEDFYYTEGYFSCKIELKLPSENDSTPVYSIVIEEGLKYKFRLTNISYSSSGLQLVEATNLSTAQLGEFKFSDITDDLQKIRNIYRKSGYLHMRVDHSEQVDSTAHVVDVTFTIDAGNQVKMGAIHSWSLRGTPESHSQRGLTDTAWFSGLWEPKRGEVVDGTYLADFRTKLLSTQIFSQVTVEDTVRGDNSGLSDMWIHATERVPGETKLGAFYEQTYGFGFSAETRHRNMGGQFHEGSIEATVAQHYQDAILGYANPLLFGTTVHFIPTAIRLDEQLIFSHSTLPFYQVLPLKQDSIQERYDIASRGDLTFGINNHLHSRTTAELRFINKPNDQQQEFLMKLETGLSLDFTDDPFEPKRGLRVGPSVGVGRAIMTEHGSRLQFSDPYPYMQVQNSLYMHLVGPLFMAATYDYGKFFGTASEDDAKIFYQGGSRSVRGFPFESIFPYQMTASDTVHAGRTPEFHRASGELRLNIPWHPLRDFQVVGFTDWTLVKDYYSQYQTANALAFGSGIRYHWKVLTLRFDYTIEKSSNVQTPSDFMSRVNIDLSQAI